MRPPGRIKGVQSRLDHLIGTDIMAVILSHGGTADLDPFVKAIGDRVAQ